MTTYKHSADSIKETPNKRFVSDNEKQTWNNADDKITNIAAMKDVMTNTIMTSDKNVISLEDSLAGSVVIDSIEGNTLVNYCTDGSTEMTLNGDIDLEGTFVTTTEGVDNGKVDVMCEGNTLVNLIKDSNRKVALISTVEQSSNASTDYSITQTLKPNTKYTIVLNGLKTSGDLNNAMIGYLGDKGSGLDWVGVRAYFENGKSNFILTTDDIAPKSIRVIAFRNKATTVEYDSCYLLEGDWRNKELPKGHFEGMKSVGELDNGTGSLEVLSKNKNYANVNENLSFDVLVTTSKIPKGIYTISFESVSGFENGSKIVFAFEDKDKKIQSINVRNGVKINLVADIEKYFFYTNGYNYQASLGNFVTINKLQMEKGSAVTAYQTYKSNTKQITMNEPLRGLPNGIRDRFVKIGGKWFIERNCKTITLDGTQNGQLASNTPESTIHYGLTVQNAKVNQRQSNSPLTNKFPRDTRANTTSDDFEGSYIESTKNLRIMIKRTKITTQDLNGINDFFSNNHTIVLYQLETPTYEPIIDSELICYLDTTHISNNSIIPCNMKIKNTGYNAIIKPSTTYTVVADTNKNQAINIELGGAKVSTSNNVAIINTTATLVDDSLRISGKTAKAKNIRLLEGDKSNNTPAMFNGLLSSFEDKDNIVGLKAVNSNLIDNGINYSNWYGEYPYIKIPNGFTLEYSKGRIANLYNGLKHLKQGETYHFSCNVELLTPLKRNLQVYRHGYGSNYGPNLTQNGKLSWTFIHDGYNNSIGIYFQNNEDAIAKANITNIQITRVKDTDYIEHLSNNINIQLKEPLRGIGNIRDRLVINNNKLLIERNCISIPLTHNLDWKKYGAQNNRPPRSHCYYIANGPFLNTDVKDNNSICDIFSKGRDVFSNADFYPSFTDYNTGQNKYFVHYLDSVDKLKTWVQENPGEMICKRKDPIYEEIDTELEKILLESYNNGTLFIDTIIAPKVNNIEYTSSISGTIDSISSDKIPAIKKEIDKIKTLTTSIEETLPKDKTIADHTIDTINRVDRLEEVLTNNETAINNINNFSLNNKALINKLLNK